MNIFTPPTNFSKVSRTLLSLLTLLILQTGFALAQDAPFITVWQTDNPGSSNDNQITIPGTGTDYLIEWEEVGNEANNNGSETGTDRHTVTFPSAGTYRVKISGDFNRIEFNYQSDREKLMIIEQWGDIVWTSFKYAFQGCINLNQSAVDVPDLTIVQDMSFMFYGAVNFNGDLSNWDVSNVSNMRYMFYEALNFNSALNNWNVSNVLDMESMFSRCSTFDQDLDNWDVSFVTNMITMFAGATSFNGNISSWNVSNVTKMGGMFDKASSFNIDISEWDVSSATVMSHMFSEASSFNQDIGNWDVSNVLFMRNMFFRASTFDQDLSEWSISQVKEMESVLSNTDISNSNLGATLIGWVREDNLPKDVNLGRLSNVLCDFDALDARAILVNEYNWTIDAAFCLNSNFVTRWNTENDGESNSNQILIPGSGTEYLIEWQEVSDSLNNGSELGSDNHILTFPKPGIYIVKISGDFTQIRFGNNGDKNKLLSIDSWGRLSWQSMESAFYGCKNLEIKATGVPYLNNVTDISSVFKETNIRANSLKSWNTFNVENMAEAFASCPYFNADLRNWSVGSATSFNNMFNGARKFNHSLNNWNISSATEMSGMLDSTGLSIYNYERTFRGWSEKTNLPINITLGAKGLAYCISDYRDILVNSKNWTIEGDFNDCSNQFITVWKTDNEGVSDDNQLEIPGRGNYRIDWEDVEDPSISGTEYASYFQTITLPKAGIYRIKISGDLERINFGIGDNQKILEIEQWGNIQWESLRSAFYNCQNLITSASDSPVLSNLTDLSRMFSNARAFNGDLSNWDVSNVTDMSYMFNQADSFNSDLNNWDVSHVLDMGYMFSGASSFNGNIDSWNVSNVTNMDHMFSQASSFNGNLGLWDVSSVRNMTHMFSNVSQFNGAIENWDVSNVTNMNGMFLDAISFNQNINNWDVSNVKNMSVMFFNASSFNSDLNNWDVSNVTNMSGMFRSAASFNSDLNNWDVSNVTDMSDMFMRASSFNQNLSLWNMSSVTDMSYMFSENSTFNSDISTWNVSKVTDMTHMFYESNLFNQNLGSWDVSSVSNMSNMLSFSGISDSNYDMILIGWSKINSLKSEVSLGVEELSFCLSKSSRNYLMNEKGWVISGDSENCESVFISSWDSDNQGESESNQVTIPANGGDYLVLWEDINNTAINGLDSASGYHTVNFPELGNYRIKISGDLSGLYFSDLGDKLKITEIENWGDIQWTSMNTAFAGAENLTITANDAPDLSQVSDMTRMFYNAKSLNQDISHWDVSTVTNMSDLFHGASSFNQDLSNWDVSNVTKMTRMFASATSFNQDLNSWNTENVVEMDFMFWEADAFQGNISDWNTSEVNNMWGMFYGAGSMNTDISNWDVSSATNMTEMFREADAFNQDISNWNTENVTDISGMFYNANAYDQNLGDWDFRNVNSLFEFLRNSGLSPANYDLSLEGWATNGNIPSDIALSAEGLFYCASAEYRQQLIDDFGWNIMGDETCSLVMEETMPAAEATSVEKNTEIHLTFDQEIEEIDLSGINLKDISGNEISLTDIYIDSLTLHLVHSGLGSNTYQVDIPENSIVSITGKENDAISWSFATQRILSSKDEQKLIEHSAYPNPFSDFTTIQFNLPQTQSVKLLIFDLKGQLVRQDKYENLGSEKQSIKFERRDLPAGLYRYQLQSAGGSVGGKMLIE